MPRKNWVSTAWDMYGGGLDRALGKAKRSTTSRINAAKRSLDDATTYKHRTRSNASPGDYTLEEGRKRTEALFDEKEAQQQRAAEETAREERKGAETGISMGAGRSRRGVKGGGHTNVLSAIGTDLKGKAAKRLADAKLQSIETKFDKEQFLADSHVTAEEADDQISKYIDSIQSDYESFWDDDEEGLAQALESYAKGKSDNVYVSAMQAASDIRSGKRKIGWL